MQQARLRKAGPCATRAARLPIFSHQRARFARAILEQVMYGVGLVGMAPTATYKARAAVVAHARAVGLEALGDLDPEVQAPLRVLRLWARIFRNGSPAAASAERLWRDMVQQAGEAGRLTER